MHEESFPTEIEAQIVDALRAAGRLSLSCVAIADYSVIAHVAFSPVTVDLIDGGLGLGPVAVLPGYRTQGVAEKLINFCLEACHHAGCGFVVVLGDPEYYRRFGFKPASDWGLVDEYGGGAAFQAIELQDGGIPATGGTVKYAPEFSVANEDAN